MVLITESISTLRVAKVKTQFYRYAGVGRPLKKWLLRGDKVLVVEKRWEWSYAVFVDEEGQVVQGWLDSFALDSHLMA